MIEVRTISYTSDIDEILARLGDDSISTEIANIYLNDAKDAVMQRMYPFGVPDSAGFPDKYKALACKLAVRYIARRGAEGEITHNENGISRSYASADDDDLLGIVTPFAMVT